MNWFAYVSICLLTTFSPGPAVILALNNSLSVGSRAAFCSSLGNVTGILCLASLSLSGLQYLLQFYPALLSWLKYLGAFYLIYLSGRMLSQIGLPLAQLASGNPAASQLTQTALFRQGFWVALSNPKSLVFFTALFPQFLGSAEAQTGKKFVMLIIFAASAMLSHSVYILAARWIGQRYRQSSPPLLWRLLPALCLAGFACGFLF